MTIERAKAKHPVTGKQLSLETLAQDVLFDNGKDLQSLYGDIEGDIFSPEVIQTNANSPIGVGDGIDVHNNVQDGAFKSAVLSGLTLNNVFSYDGNVNSNITQVGSVFTVTHTSQGDTGVITKGYIPFTTGKTYTIKLKVKSVTRSVLQIQEFDNSTFANKVVLKSINLTVGATTTINTTVTTTRDSGRLLLSVQTNGEVGDITEYSDILIIEGDQTANDIPYFEGMQSVQMPVLSTMNKNLNYKPMVLGSIGNDGKDNVSSNSIRSDYLNVDGGEVYSLSNDKNYAVHICFEYDINKNFIRRTTNQGVGDPTFTTTENTRFVRFRSAEGNVENDLTVVYQLENSKSPTELVVNKTNNLSCLEPVELGSVGDVKDTLDVLTGEVVENTVEYTATGNENIVISSNLGNTTRFIVNIEPTLKADHVIMSNKFISKLDFSGDYEHVHANKNTIWLYVSNEKTGGTITGLKDWLKNNTTILRCQLATPIVKTVDLSGTPFGFAKGHVQLSNGFEGNMTYNDGFTFPYDVNISKVTTKTGEIIDITGISGNGTSVITIPTCTNATDYIVTCTPVQSLLPQIKYQVPTSRTGQITQNTNVIMKHDKKIYSLEMMLMSSSVDDAYARYMLQNDVQVARFATMSDDANLNPLRYHMLERLIEEDMYDEVDMLAKLDIFMMYGEISMDQYFELTDIVLGFTEEFVEEF